MKMKTFVLTLFSRTHAYDAFIKALIMHNGCRQKKKKECQIRITEIHHTTLQISIKVQ